MERTPGRFRSFLVNTAQGAYEKTYERSRTRGMGPSTSVPTFDAWRYAPKFLGVPEQQ